MERMKLQPTLVFVPGLWESHAGVFASVVGKLKERYEVKTIVASLVSTGCISPGNPTLLDDIAVVRSFIEPVVRREEDVILVMHSAGGYVLGIDKWGAQGC